MIGAGHIEGERTPFRHEAVLYAGDDGFVAALAPFIRAGRAAGEPVMAMVPGRKIALLREELGSDADGVTFADMTGVGANPMRIIPAWREFAASRDGHRPMRGVGEPIWAGRSRDELVECQRHEALINLAFADVTGFHLVCPYDAEALGPDVLHEARCSHPVVVEEDGACGESSCYRSPEETARPFSAPLSAPATSTYDIPFDSDTLEGLRAFVARRAQQAGLRGRRLSDLVLAVNEATTNSVRHGGGRGLLRTWMHDGAFVCEISDSGRIEDPLVGRVRPPGHLAEGYGMWLVNQVCDLVEVRAYSTGSVVRMRLNVG